MAQTYGIFDYKEHKPSLIATLVLGLGSDSRIVKAYSNDNYTINDWYNANIIDNLSTILWCLKGGKAEDRPVYLTELMRGIRKESDIKGFDSAEEFDRAMALKRQQFKEEESNNG